MHSVGRIWKFSVLKLVVHKVNHRVLKRAINPSSTGLIWILLTKPSLNEHLHKNCCCLFGATLSSFVSRRRPFEETYCLYFHAYFHLTWNHTFFRSSLLDLPTQLHGVVSQKTALFVIMNVRMSKQHEFCVRVVIVLLSRLMFLFARIPLLSEKTQFVSPIMAKYLILWYIIWYDMIYLLTAIGLPPSGSSTVHIYTQKIHRTTLNKQYIGQHKNFGRVRAVPRLGQLYPGICLTTENEARKTLSRVAEQ
jgi:hypothetical protein